MVDRWKENGWESAGLVLAQALLRVECVTMGQCQRSLGLPPLLCPSVGLD